MGLTLEEMAKSPYWDSVKDHVDSDGWFPDSILGDAIWVLTWCSKKRIGDNLYWRINRI